MEQSSAVDLLFIDDDRSFMSLARQLLSKHQGRRFTVHWTQTGQAAMEELEKNPASS